MFLELRNPAIQVFLALVLGFCAGLALQEETAILTLFEPVGTLWINAVRMPVLLLVPSILVLAVADAQAAATAGRVGLVALAVMVSLLVLFAAAMIPLAPSLLGNLELEAAAVASLRARATMDGGSATPFSLGSWLANLFPANPVRAAVDGALLPLVAFSLLYGAALSRVRAGIREVHLSILRGTVAALTAMVRWILRAAPVGVAALGLSLGARLGLEAVAPIARYVAVAILLLLVALGIVYALLLGLRIVPVTVLVQALLPAQAIAFASRSSLATLPILIDAALERLRLPERVANMVLPLGAAVFKLNSPITWPLGAILVARLYGIDLGTPELVVIAVASVLLSLTTPGIPSGGFFVQAPLYAAVGLPVEGLGLLIAVDLVIDLFKTTLNVTSYVAVAGVVARVVGARRVHHG